MNPQEIRERLSAILKEQEALEAKADAEKRSLSDDEQKSYSRLDDEYKQLSAKQTRMQERLARQSNLGNASNTSPAREAAGNSSPIKVGKTLVEDDPKRGFRHTREFLMAVHRHAQTPDADLPTDGMKMLRKGSRQFAAGTDEQSTVTGAYGGFLVPTAFTPEVLQIEPEPDPLAGKTRRIPMTAPRIEIPARVDKDHSTSVSGGFTVARRGETKQATASRGEYEKIGLSANMLIGLTYATEELLMDSPISFAALIGAGFQSEFNSTILNERINGAAAMEYTGVLTSGAKISVTAETGQAATTLVYENVIKMMARCYKYDNAVWIANQNVLPQLALMNVKVGTGGGPVWMMNAVAGAPQTICGRPVIFTDCCKTLGTSGDIILCNWNEYLEAIYTPLQTDESIHVRFDYVERAFRFFIRCGGSPWWKSALTPKNGSTLSPIVVLASRT
jgi:HK97 family phage major capsid protein